MPRTSKNLSLLLCMAVACCTVVSVPRAVASPLESFQQNKESLSLTKELDALYNEDQKLLDAFYAARAEPGFAKSYLPYAKRAQNEGRNQNFFDAQACELWSQASDAPEIVRRYAAFRRNTDARLKAIVATDGWPQRRLVGDVAAAEFFFLFGHADEQNAWRVSLLPEVTRVFKQDHVNPRLYAHLVDRINSVAGKPQIYGSIMGPGAEPGTAKLYWPLIDTPAAADERRAQIGLPTIEHDLSLFREGASIGNYMTPTMKGQKWNIGDVYRMPNQGR